MSTLHVLALLMITPAVAIKNAVSLSMVVYQVLYAKVPLQARQELFHENLDSDDLSLSKRPITASQQIFRALEMLGFAT